jgi:hypothetical protein
MLTGEEAEKASREFDAAAFDEDFGSRYAAAQGPALDAMKKIQSAARSKGWVAGKIVKQQAMAEQEFEKNGHRVLLSWWWKNGEGILGVYDAPSGSNREKSVYELDLDKATSGGKYNTEYLEKETPKAVSAALALLK